MPTKLVPPGTRYHTYYIKSPPWLQTIVGEALQPKAHFSTLGGLVWTDPFLDQGALHYDPSDKVATDFVPSQYLLHHSALSVQTYKKYLLSHMINAARVCVLVHWIDRLTPSVKEWLIRLNRLEEMEELILKAQDKISSFTTTWASWLQYKNTDTYKLCP